MDDDQVLALLRSIDRRLALLTGPQERAVREALAADVLNTEPRLRVFYAIDGSRGNPQLATVAGLTPRAIQNFVNQLLELGLVRQVGAGREVIVERDEDGIVRWFLGRPTEPSPARLRRRL